MDNDKYTTVHDGVKPSPNLTPTEAYLTSRFGDLHNHIGSLLEHHSQAEIAASLSDDKLTVSQTWVSWWLRRNNYRRVSRYVRKGGVK